MCQSQPQNSSWAPSTKGPYPPGAGLRFVNRWRLPGRFQFHIERRRVGKVQPETGHWIQSSSLRTTSALTRQKSRASAGTINVKRGGRRLLPVSDLEVPLLTSAGLPFNCTFGYGESTCDGESLETTTPIGFSQTIGIEGHSVVDVGTRREVTNRPHKLAR